MMCETYESEALNAFGGVDLPEAVTNTFVHSGVGLKEKRG